MKVVFTEWLKEQGVYDQYINSIGNVDKIHTTDYIKDNILKKNYVSDPFNWEITVEGHVFWSEVDRAWRNIVYSNKYEIIFMKEGSND